MRCRLQKSCDTWHRPGVVPCVEEKTTALARVSRSFREVFNNLSVSSLDGFWSFLFGTIESSKRLTEWTLAPLTNEARKIKKVSLISVSFRRMIWLMWLCHVSELSAPYPRLGSNLLEKHDSSAPEYLQHSKRGMCGEMIKNI